SGNSLKILQEILGHSYIRTTERYAHLETTVAGSVLERTIRKQEEVAGVVFGTNWAHALPPPKRTRPEPAWIMAGAEGLEPTNFGFVDPVSEEPEPRGSAASSESSFPPNDQK
ncbi:MAG: hypothetical protein AAGJ54_03600, partial [Planctomycetota bacterium]